MTRSLPPPPKRLPPDPLDVELRDMSDAIVLGMPRVPPPPKHPKPKPFGGRAKPVLRLPSLWNLVVFGSCVAMAYSMLSLTWYMGGLRWCVYLVAACGFGVAVLRSMFRAGA